MPENDTQLEFKKRARRRLVGAVALALLAAIVLPIVMDQPPEPPNQDIQLRIPGRDTPFDARLSAPARPSAEKGPAQPPMAAIREPAPVEDPAPEKLTQEAAAPVLPSPPPAQSPQKASVPRSTKQTAPPATRTDTLPTQSKLKPPPKPIEKLEEKPAEKPPEKAVEKVDETRQESSPAPQKPAEEERAQAILNARDNVRDNERDNGRGKFVVQLGVFGDPANVRKVQAQVRAAGYSAYSESLPGGKTRIKAGPFAGRDAAQKALDKLKRSGISGIVASKP